MGKKNKDKPKKEKDKSKIDERVKQINAIQPPDSNPFKMDNESKIDQFMRFGTKKKFFRGTIREKLRRKKDRANRFD
ncbi:MAG: hypothetical protein V1740_03285 [Candidatus Woesearchaeota archaeon]